jgi:hypothetical protein
LGAIHHQWQSSRGTGILNNELYIGRLVWNRLRYVKDPETGKRVSRPNPPDQLIVQQRTDSARLTACVAGKQPGSGESAAPKRSTRSLTHP